MLPKLLTRPWLIILVTGLSVAVFSILAVFSNGVTNDSWWHLRVGKDLWEGTFTFEDQYSFTAKGDFWPAHELGFEWLLYGLWLLGGESFQLMGILNLLLVLGTFALLTPPKRLREKWNLSWNVFVPLLGFAVAFTLLGFVQIRAQAISFILLALTIRLILAKRPQWIPLVFLAWVWLHGSVFIGVATLGFATLVMIGRWLLKRSHKERQRDALVFSISGLASLVATCLSPLGFGLWTYFLQALNFGKTTIGEWRPLVENPLILAFALLALGIMLFFVGRFGKLMGSWELIFLYGLSLFMFFYSMTAVRVYSTFILGVLALLFIAVMYEPRLKSTAPATAQEKQLTKVSLVASGVLLASSLFFVLPVNAAILELGSRNPFEARGVLEVLESDKCEGGIWNDYDTGSYMIWFTPDIPVSVDSRFDVYSRWVTDTVGITIPENEEDDARFLLNRAFEKYKIKCFVLSNRDDAKELEKRGLPVLARNHDMVVFDVEKDGIPPKKE